MTNSAATALAASIAAAAIAYTAHAPARSPIIPVAPTIALAAVPASGPAQGVATTSPAAQAATAPAAAPAFRGWVRIGSANPANPGATLHNTVTGAGVFHNGAGQNASIVYQNPATGEYSDYYPSTNLIRIGTLSPDRKESLIEYARELPLNLAAAIAPLRQILGHEPQGIVHRTDGGLDYYDFSAPLEEARKALQAQGNDVNEAASDLFGVPTSIWIDPATGLTQRMVIGDVTSTYTYGGPDITSIYDAGAPKTAKVYDNRPTAETLAVLDRVNKRAATPMPDGVSVILYESDQAASISVYEQSKNHWTQRAYTVCADRPDPFMINLPADWASTGTDEFFRRLAGAAAGLERAGDESDVRFRDFTPYTPAATQPKLFPDGSRLTTITKAHYTGRAAKSVTLIDSAAYYLFAIHISGQFGVDNHASLTADPQHPGLIGLRDELRRLTSDSVRGYDEYWIDPAHGDRIVQHVEESFEDPPAEPHQSALVSSSGKYREITDYSDYATLPDGREYARRSTTTDYIPTRRGRFAPSATRSATFHFFPNRTLPPLKIPATQPADLP